MLLIKAGCKCLLKMLKWLEICETYAWNLCAMKKIPISSIVSGRRVELTTLEKMEVMVKFCNDFENERYT